MPTKETTLEWLDREVPIDLMAIIIEWIFKNEEYYTGNEYERKILARKLVDLAYTINEKWRGVPYYFFSRRHREGLIEADCEMVLNNMPDNLCFESGEDLKEFAQWAAAMLSELTS